jgi:hypothetical protein
MMNIEILMKSKVDNPTEFEAGDIIQYDGNALNTKCLVVGENHLFLHSFCIETGGYYGINKNPKADNLKVITKIN